MKKLLLIAGSLGILITSGCEKEREEPAAAKERTPPPGKSPDRGGSPPTPQADTVENLADEFSLQLKKMTGAMAGVRDSASAKQAAETVHRVGEEFRSIVARLQKLEVPSPARKKSISEKMELRAAEMAESLGGREEFMKSLDPDVRAVLARAMVNFDETMGELDPIMSEYFEESEGGATPTPKKLPNRPTILPKDLPRQPVPPRPAPSRQPE